MKIRIDLKVIFLLILFFFTNQLEFYILSMGFALIHEICHIIVGKMLGFSIVSIEMMPFGFLANIKPFNEDYKVKFFKANLVELKYILILFAGPIINLIFAIIFFRLEKNILALELKLKTSP